MIGLAPKAALGPTPPAVGVFWFVFVVLVISRSVPDEGEPDGECDTHQICNLKSKNVTVLLAPESCPFGPRHSPPLPNSHKRTFRVTPIPLKWH
jgi:hypothetical protein